MSSKVTRSAGPSAAGQSAAELDPTGTGEAPRAASHTRRVLGILIGIAVVVLALDQVTKHLAVVQLTDRDPVRLLGGSVYLVLTRNSGAAFSLARDHTYVFPVIALAVAGWIGWMARQVRSVPWAISLGLVLGGALGNLVDRIFRWPSPFLGHVVDFISVFDDNGQAFPIFNVADMSLVTGVSLAILLELTGRRRDGTRMTGATAAAAAGPDVEADGPAVPGEGAAVPGEGPAVPGVPAGDADQTCGQTSGRDRD